MNSQKSPDICQKHSVPGSALAPPILEEHTQAFASALDWKSDLHVSTATVSVITAQNMTALRMFTLQSRADRLRFYQFKAPAATPTPPPPLSAHGHDIHWRQARGIRACQWKASGVMGAAPHAGAEPDASRWSRLHSRPRFSAASPGKADKH